MAHSGPGVSTFATITASCEGSAVNSQPHGCGAFSTGSQQSSFLTGAGWHMSQLGITQRKPLASAELPNSNPTIVSTHTQRPSK